MKIEEISTTGDVNPLVEIVATHSSDAEHLDSVRVQLQEELSEAGDNRLIFVAHQDDTTVAMIQLVLKNADNDPEQANGKDIVSVHNLQVRSEHQGQGIGRKMMAFIEEKARQLGNSTITLGVDDTNSRAIDLYNGLDYKVFKTEPGRYPEEKCFIMKKGL